MIISTGNAQTISDLKYNHKLIHEDFNTSDDKYFDYMVNDDNHLTTENGDFFIIRKNKQTSYKIFIKHDPINNFILETNFRIGPNNNKDASFGIILKTRENRKDAIVLEINKKREYRIKQLLDNTYQTLSGKEKKDGWVKSKLVNGVDQYNFIEIRTEDNIYDIYLNSKYLTTFSMPDYTSGSCGLIISAETKARVSYYYINTKDINNTVDNYTNKNTEDVTSTTEEFNKKIQSLEVINSKLTDLNSKLQQKSNSTNLSNEITIDLNNKVEGLNNQLSTANTELKKLSTTNAELKALFIQKDFETNGVKPSDLIKQTKIYPTPKELKGDNTIYTVQFGAYMQVQSYAALKGLDEVWYETTEHGTYVYLSGQFKAPQEATEHKNSLMTLGYPNAFVVTLTK